ncbi:hypothetical protein B0H34DRAFT_802785 [Crassisporium funariophilum]|nr:hypothetical protein B0H34DRAFT_802785 [Crassisporium funariophilum]
MVNGLDTGMYQRSKGRLAALEPSQPILRVADSRLVLSSGVWRGWVSVKNIHYQGVFEVFSSGGEWALLFGKPLLKSFKAVHNYSTDIIRIPPQLANKDWVTLENQYASKGKHTKNLLVNLTVDIKQRIDTLGNGSRFPLSVKIRRKETWKSMGTTWRADKDERTNINMQRTWRKAMILPKGSPDTFPAPRTDNITHNIISSEIRNPAAINHKELGHNNWRSVWLLDTAPGDSSAHPGTAQPDITRTFEPTLLTRQTDPRNPARVAAILAEIRIGTDITPKEYTQVCKLISEFVLEEDPEREGDSDNREKMGRLTR